MEWILIVMGVLIGGRVFYNWFSVRYTVVRITQQALEHVEMAQWMEKEEKAPQTSKEVLFMEYLRICEFKASETKKRYRLFIKALQILAKKDEGYPQLQKLLWNRAHDAVQNYKKLYGKAL